MAEVEVDDRAAELEGLVAEQTADELEQVARHRGRRRRGRRREVNATDLGRKGQGWAVLDHASDRPGRGRDWSPPEDRDDLGLTVYLVGCRPWEAWQDMDPAALLARASAAEDRGESIPLPSACPVCGGRRLTWDRYCMRCDRAGKDGKVRYRGMPVGSAQALDCPAAYIEQPKLRPGRLKGGTG